MGFIAVGNKVDGDFIGQARLGRAVHGEERCGMAGKIFVIDDELREELRIPLDRENRYERVLARQEVLSSGEKYLFKVGTSPTGIESPEGAV